MRIVMDLGYGTLPRLLDLLGTSVADGIDPVIVTHKHPDHMLDLHGLFRTEPSAHERLTGVRKELNVLVAAGHHRSGSPHGMIHAELRRACGGPPAAEATSGDLVARIDKIREWAARRRTS